jgi:DNA-binding CsgD family transcriptional regulator/tetratricopeptide (TPR) repeat protein
MLVERAAQLAVLDAAVEEAVAGHGRLLLVGGEAGVGKTALVGAAAARAAGRIRLLRGVFDNITTPAPLGALVDASAELADLIEAEATNRPALFRRVRDAVSATPTMLVLEDVHWADEATLDLLRFLGRRLDGVPLLIVATYRSDEVVARHPLSLVLGDLAAEAAVSRLAVEALSAAGVADLVAASGDGIDPADLHRRSGGNAFYVTEVLAAPERDVPTTVRDAVLARTMRLSEPGRDILAAAAVLGHPADPLLLAEIAERDPTDVDECADRGLLVTDHDGLTFRHDLARRAVESTVPPGRMLTLHSRALAALRTRGSEDDRRLARHAAAAGERDAASLHSERAAAHAARLGAHREAVRQYRAALRFAGNDIDDLAGRSELLIALSYECYLTGETAEAIAARRKVMELAELAGDLAAVGGHQRWLSRLFWYSGQTVDAHRYGERAVRTLEPFGDSHELGMAYSNKAQLAMLASDLADAVQWGRRALALADRINDREIEMHALNNVGSAMLQFDSALPESEGRRLLTRSLDLALRDDAHEHAARAYTNLASMAVLNREFANAETYLRAGIAYSLDRDLESWTAYMEAFLARTFSEQGRLDDALASVQHLLRRPRLASVTLIVVNAVAGQVAARRGDDPVEWLDHAWELAAATQEAQRLAPVAAVAAEAAWLAGAPPPVEMLDTAWAAVTARPVAWEVAEVGFWRDRAGLPTETTTPLPEPFALMHAGQWRVAARSWQVIGCPIWQAMALGRDDGLDGAREAFELLARVGAPAVWAAIARDRYAAGLAVPRGPRPARAANPAGLTARELDVLRLLADGLSNPAIAETLFLSARTVEHHVSAVLRKLDEPSRGRAVSSAIRQGFIDAPT